eukprot:TRINITY_DN87303_c0_g1_i1.p1 TRINITY_DN87303_c0_g1~~TRINITY_DN87303_c0_g1_i1.p1  ORF type:complete len:400 (+),score=85.55 TRINITY_DN87303_c0_g1_i1:79-1278(+)
MAATVKVTIRALDGSVLIDASVSIHATIKDLQELIEATDGNPCHEQKIFQQITDGTQVELSPASAPLSNFLNEDAEILMVRVPPDCQAMGKLVLMVRVRALADSEQPIVNVGMTELADATFENHISVQDKTFRVHHALGEEASQEDVFSAVGLPLVRRMQDGSTVNLLIYGQEGAAKWHTLAGTDEDPGLVPRMTRQLMSDVLRSAGFKPHICCAAMEFHADTIRDLLSRESPGQLLEVTMGPSAGNVKGSTVLNAHSAQELQDFFDLAQRNLASAEPNFIFKVVMEAAEGSKRRWWGKMNIIYTGSSARSDPGMTELQRREAICRNSTLTALWLVMASSDEKKLRINSRQSKLTMALFGSLGRMSPTSTAIIGHASPAERDLQETLSMLRCLEQSRAD